MRKQRKKASVLKSEFGNQSIDQITIWAGQKGRGRAVVVNREELFIALLCSKIQCGLSLPKIFMMVLK